MFINQIAFLPTESFFLLSFMLVTVRVCVPVQACECVCVRVWVFLYESVYVSLWVYVCDVYVFVWLCVRIYPVCVFMAQIENFAGDTNNKVPVNAPCSCFSAYKPGMTICLVDIEMHHRIKHLEIALLDIK